MSRHEVAMLTGANAAYLVIPTFVAKLAGAAVIATKDARGRVDFPPDVVLSNARAFIARSARE